MKNDQIVTITFFRYEGFRRKWWAFGQMGVAPKSLETIPGLEFGKMLGSGSRNGFSILPNLSVYGLLCVWENEWKARNFFEKHPLFAAFCEKSSDQWTVYMRTVMAHGRWDGAEPFQIQEKFDENRLIGVITRATIRVNHLWRFWRFVPSVSRSVKSRDGLLFSVGIGELPIIQQATFSLWENSYLMKAYAYQSRFHKEVVRRTRELGWYKEELFARFHPYTSEGNWRGQNPLALYLPVESSMSDGC